MKVLVKSSMVEVNLFCLCKLYDPTGGCTGDSCGKLCVNWCPTQATHCSTGKPGMAPQSSPIMNS